MIIAYLRCSTDDQDVAHQRGAITASGHAIDEWFIDEGISGAQASRPAWDKCRQALRENRGSTLVVFAKDRIARDFMEWLRLMTFFADHDVKLVSLTGSTDLATDEGQLIEVILGWAAALERKKIRQRAQSGMDNAKRDPMSKFWRQKKQARRHDHAAILTRLRAKESVTSIANDLGVSTGTISRIGSQREKDGMV